MVLLVICRVTPTPDACVKTLQCTQSPEVRALSGNNPSNSGLRARSLISEVMDGWWGISKLVQCLVLRTYANFHHEACVS